MTPTPRTCVVCDKPLPPRNITGRCAAHRIYGPQPARNKPRIGEWIERHRAQEEKTDHD